MTRLRWTKLASLSVATALLATTAISAITPPESAESKSILGTAAFSTPGLKVHPTQDIHLAGAVRAAGLPGLTRFMADSGDQWEVRFDSRNNRPNLIQGVGIPVIPGRGNNLKAADLGLAKGQPSLAEVEHAVRAFMAAYPELLNVAGMDLRLDTGRSGPYGGYFWNIELQQFHNGVPVEDAHVYFRINNGNIVQFGVNRVAEVRIDATARISAEQALQSVVAGVSFRDPIAERSVDGKLHLYPIAAEGQDHYGERFTGDAGRGYDHVLVYEHIFKLAGSDEPLRTLVDAHTGKILELRSEMVFAQVSGGIYPTTNTDPIQQVGFGYTAVTNGTAKVTDAAGNYTFTAGTATSTLNGRYFRMSDSCGSISLSNSTTGDLNFSSSTGTNCTTPGVGGAGNTHSSRSGFYHLTNINRKAATYLPSNSWLGTTVTANMNINDTCNAFWNGSTVNFYRSGGGCSNTGEIAAVFLHEWGHGMDTNSGGAASEYGSGEAVGDTFAFLETKDACIGNNFQPGSPCQNCRTTCTGVRDLEPFQLGGSRTIASPANVTANNGINCDAWSCPYLIQGITPYQGPMGYEGHCESYIASTANWDMKDELVAALGTTAGWQKADAIWYGSLQASKSAYQVASGGKCNAAATVNGCGSQNWYTVYLAVDDNNGNLADGTPNGCRIWSAFNAHGIACGTQPACSGGGGGNTAPSVSITAPANGSSFPVGTSVSFTGTATDTQDGNLSANISWSSSLNGALGTGASISTSSLSAGTHTITASVTDTGSLSGSSSITVNITNTSSVLTNGVPVTGLAGATGSSTYFTMVVPSGATNLQFVTSGGSGDMDLYARFNAQPTTSTFNCSGTSATNNETCTIAAPSAGTYHVLMYGYSAYSGVTLTGSYSTSSQVTVTLYSVAAEDGRLYETTETADVGGGGNSTENTTSSLRVGDWSDDTQYRSIVSFDTSSIPDGATIVSATLRLKRGTLSGTSPFTTHGTCTVDIHSSGFGGAVAFANGDFQAAATSSGVASMTNPASNGTFSDGVLNAAGRNAINKTGKTQFRVYMTLGDNDDLGTDYMGFYSGEAATANRPQLVVTYQ